ncbi:type 2 isopentenyl-diphosphate Delta-isomerase [Sciscionella sediminilitoris]|uniref:type 2 isopentenyl-diphosphate Delta-isomerase n=1 Tax=Sciscionella sediminilitoris TaxID=1445613 RepID=UPI0009E83B40|nr:type 2 isopentenyl-diphosphate Delta-isomerase [Sciscionella sp. SE31]
MSGELTRRKRSHIDVCLNHEVAYTRRATGFEEIELPYRALPETDLAAVDTTTEFLGKPLRAPVLIGAMTGGAELAGTINANLAVAAHRLGIGLMLGSQRVMLENPDAARSFQVRQHAPDALLIGNLGVAQLAKGYDATQLRRAVAEIGADALALHTNPLQEANQPGGDTNFTGLAHAIRTVVGEVEFPVLLKEVGHGISARCARSVADAGLAALDVAGAGGTSWAKVEQLAAHGTVVSPDLAEWGIPTATALREVRAELPELPLVASGGIRSGLDAAKAIASGARVVAVAYPLLHPAVESADAVTAWLERFITELRIGMFCAGCPDLAALSGVNPGT